MLSMCVAVNLAQTLEESYPKLFNTCNVATIGFLYFGPYSTLQNLLKSSLISEAYAKIIFCPKN